MSNYRITISFRDAGLFQRPRKPGTEQLMLTPGGLVNREENNAYADAPANTILRSCVANMFRVLLGYRPVPTFRGATEAHIEDSQCDIAVDLAKRALVSVETGITTNKTGEEYLLREMQMTNKYASPSGTSSWGKSSIAWAGPDPLTYRVSWYSVSSEFGAEVFAEFKNVIIEVLGQQALDLDMVSVFSALYLTKDKSKLVEFFSKGLVSKFYEDTILHGKTAGQYFGHSGNHEGLKHWHWDLVTRGVNQVSRRSGKITLDVSREEWLALKNGPNMATLLDGGFAEITDMCDADEDIRIEGVPTFDHEEI